MKLIVSAILLVILITNVLILAVNVQRVEAMTITVPDDYPTIQEAINHASEGDTVYVKDGTYYESVMVNVSISLIGENPDLTVIEVPNGMGSNSFTGITVAASNVTIQGFKLIGSGTWATRGEYNEGIFIELGTYGTSISNCIFTNWVDGIIWEWNGSAYFDQCEVTNNTFLSPEDNGIVDDCSESAILFNNISVSDWGISVGEESQNLISGNIISSGLGLEIDWLGVSNKIVGNTVSGCTYGIYLGVYPEGYGPCSDQEIYHNNFINNLCQVYLGSGSVDTWDNGYPSGGNYWSDYTGVDLYSGPYQNLTGSDGIGDTPYVIDANNIDKYPLMSPYVPFENQTICIRADGSVDPSYAPISSPDNITYTFTDNISYPTYRGIVVQRSNIVIDGNGYTVQGSQSGNGLCLESINNVTVKDTNVESFYNGITLDSSSNDNSISGNNITANTEYGVYLFSSSNNSISGNNITNNFAGIILDDSSNNTVSGNNATSNGCGITLTISSNNNVISGNNVANDGTGVWLANSNNNAVSGNNATSNGCGIYLGSSSNNNVISGNVARANTEGIWLTSSNNNTVSGNNATSNTEYGILVTSSSNNNTVSGNNAAADAYGIEIGSSSNNTVSENTVTSNSAGIWLDDSNDTTVSGNVATGNPYDIWLFFSSNNTVSGNVATAGGYGILLGSSSDDNLVSGNNATANNDDGIVLYLSSNNNVICGNNAAANHDAGIALTSSSVSSSCWNIVTANNITSNNIGLKLVYASNNTIYHNNFVTNIAQVSIDSDSASLGNAWNDTYPSGGNYWSDYSGVDQKSGPNQDQSGGDGIGDTPYIIDTVNNDSYPLMGPFSSLCSSAGQASISCVSNSTISGFQLSGNTMSFTVSGVPGTTGFCTVTIPYSTMSPPYNVYVDGKAVSYTTIYQDATQSVLYFTYEHSIHAVTITGSLGGAGGGGSERFPYVQ